MIAGILPELPELLAHVLVSHSQRSTKESNAFRKWDGRTPYGVHPIWAAATFLTETSLSEGLRIRGSRALALHDILENTDAALVPGHIEYKDSEFWEVYKLVGEMTFDSFAKETEEIWERSPESRLLKLYDKVSNLLDGSWMNVEKRAIYEEFVTRLIADVERNYGALNIVRIAKAIVGGARA